MKLISYLCSVIIKQGELIMKKNELIEKIEVIMRDNSGITFDTPEEIAGEELLSISYCGELSFADDEVEVELEDLQEIELDNLLYIIERQLEADEKVFERCRGSYY